MGNNKEEQRELQERIKKGKHPETQVREASYQSEEKTITAVLVETVLSSRQSDDLECYGCRLKDMGEWFDSIATGIRAMFGYQQMAECRHRHRMRVAGLPE